MPIVYLFMMMSLLLPLADIAIAGFQFVSAWQALRAFGQSIQYNPPPDVTDTGVWKSTLPNTVAGYPISNLQVVVDGPIKYFSYTTTVTISPMVLSSVLCTSSCSFTLPYSERFQ
jgi:hypothetical protein